MSFTLLLLTGSLSEIELLFSHFRKEVTISSRTCSGIFQLCFDTRMGLIGFWRFSLHRVSDDHADDEANEVRHGMAVTACLFGRTRPSLRRLRTRIRTSSRISASVSPFLLRDAARDSSGLGRVFRTRFLRSALRSGGIRLAVGTTWSLRGYGASELTYFSRISQASSWP